MKGEKEIELGFKVSKINTLKFSFVDIEEGSFQNLLKEEGVLQIGLNIGIIISEDESTISVDVESNLKNSSSDITLISHTARTVFKIKGLLETKNSEEDSFNLPDGFIVQLYSIAYSHARALLAVELSPTVYKDKFILPIVDPMKFLQKK